MKREIPPGVKEYLRPPDIRQGLTEAEKEKFPLPDEPFCASWQAYCEEAREKELYPVLQRHLLQLQFPVKKGMSGTEAYRQATRRGISAGGKEAAGLELKDPEKLKLHFYPTPAAFDHVHEGPCYVILGLGIIFGPFDKRMETFSEYFKNPGIKSPDIHRYHLFSG